MRESENSSNKGSGFCVNVVDKNFGFEINIRYRFDPRNKQLDQPGCCNERNNAKRPPWRCDVHFGSCAVCYLSLPAASPRKGGSSRKNIHLTTICVKRAKRWGGAAWIHVISRGPFARSRQERPLLARWCLCGFTAAREGAPSQWLPQLNLGE